MNRIIPGNMRIPLALAVVFNCITYYGARILTADRIHYDLSIGLDDRIPFMPWTVSIYWGCYLFWIINYIIGCRQRSEEAFRFVSADFAAKAVCLICFLALPTTNSRPAVEGSCVWSELMRMLYRVDAADNLFPSIHCLTSWFCFIAVRKNPGIPGWYKAASLLIAVSICLSTLTTKQHVLIDVFGGIALAEGSWLFVEKSGFSGQYARILSRAGAKHRRGEESF